jgi:hypothetical protein
VNGGVDVEVLGVLQILLATLEKLLLESDVILCPEGPVGLPDEPGRRRPTRRVWVGKEPRAFDTLTKWKPLGLPTSVTSTAIFKRNAEREASVLF